MNKNRTAIGDLCECCLASSASANDKLFDMKKYQFEISPNKTITYFESYCQYIDQEFIITNARDGVTQKICQPCAIQLQNCVMFRQKCIMSQQVLNKQRLRPTRSQTKRIALQDRTSASNIYPLTFQYSSTISTTSHSQSENEMPLPELPRSITFDNHNGIDSSITTVSDHCASQSTVQEQTYDAAPATSPLPPEGMVIDETDDEERERRSATQQKRSQAKRRKKPTLQLFSSDEDDIGVVDEFRSWY
jgi:hypothetical protein